MNRDEILNSWETDGIYRDWYAVDSYNPQNGKMRRLFVGTEDDAVKAMRTFSEPTDLAMQPFYRCSVIAASDARAYFDGAVDELPDERSVYSITEAASILGVSRQRVHQLIESGKLDAHKVGSTWSIYRYSVENRLER